MSDTLTSFYPFVDDIYTSVCDSDWSDNSERENGVIAGNKAYPQTINTALRSSSVAVQSIIEWAAAQVNAYDSDTWSTNTLASISLFSSYSDISDLIDAGVKATISSIVDETGLSTLSSDLETLSSGLSDGTITVYTTSYLGTSDVGSAGNPIYLYEGSPEECNLIQVLDNLIFLYGGETLDSDMIDMFETGTTCDYYSIYICFDTLTSDSLYSEIIDIGYSNTISADDNIVIGTDNTISNTYNTIFGFNNTVSSGYNLSLGYSNTATSEYSTVIGYSNSEKSSLDCHLFGISNSTTGNGTSLCGYSNTANGDYAVCLGSSNQANGDYAVAIGTYNYAVTENSILLGVFNSVTTEEDTNIIKIGVLNANDAGKYSISIGSGTSAADYSIALGSYAAAIGCYSVAIGSGTETVSAAWNDYGVAVGYCSIESNDYPISFSSNITKGNTAKGIYINSGIVAACSGTVGSSVIPVYMSSGVITKCEMFKEISSSYFSVQYRAGSSSSFSTLSLDTVSGYTDTFSLYAFQCENLVMFAGNYQKHSDSIYDDYIYKITLPLIKNLPCGSGYYTYYYTFISCTATSINSQLTIAKSSTLSGTGNAQILTCWGSCDSSTASSPRAYLYIGTDVYDLDPSLGNSYCVGFSFVAYFRLGRKS